jgi:cell division transport system ATP-binding protein
MPNRQKSEQIVIELKNAGFTYGGRDILSDMSLRLSPGSFHFLTGPSGSGKTTLLNLCYQALLPTTGMVRVFEQDVRAMSRDDIARVRRRIGVVHQNCQFLDHLSLRDNVALPLAVSGRQDEIDAGQIEDLLGWVGLSEKGDAKPPELSGGERQRAALARAIIMSPDLILADEPTGNVDWEMAQRLLALLVELNKMGKTILIATHDLNLIRGAKSAVSARVLRISNTKLNLAGADL